ncbi:hypothetical protein AQUSIP_12990 [Aquicella siphonis]|uniref:Uncharacterized protein n=1 Tax=Aquicella siphonis TaxID=254247 RepID=A0A5E4PHK0_9COXI|nr:hypothetical protein [Aquicella siphonis]VVC75998.1 hypothetical protein AQUSIP_12990 [Aquicella siphonis]
MADIYDVQNTLTVLAANALYPNGLNAPSVVNTDVSIYPGWPLPKTLDAALTARQVHISIFPTVMARATTRFDTQYLAETVNPATLTLTADDEARTITVGGTISTPQTCLLKINGYDYAYSVQATDTLNTVAAGIATLIPGAYATGNLIFLSALRSITVNISTSGTASREFAREERVLFMSCWCPTPQIRAAAVQTLNTAFAATPRIVLPDGYYAHLVCTGTRDVDELQKVKCYRGDLELTVEYAITQTETAYTVGENIANVNLEPVLPAGKLLLFTGGDFLLLNSQNYGLLE